MEESGRKKMFMVRGTGCNEKTKKRETYETPFALVYGKEVVLPIEVGLPTITTLIAENAIKNQRQLVRNLDLLKEIRECA